MKEVPGVNPQCEGLEIPDNWKFPERNQAGLKVKQIDVNQRFLAFDLPDLGGHKGQYCDYFFNSDGEPTDSRHHHDVFTGVQLRKYDMQAHFGLQESVSNRRLMIVNVILSEPAVDGAGAFKRNGVLAFGNFGLNYFNEHDGNNYLEVLDLGENFGRDKTGNMINGSKVVISKVPSKKLDKFDSWASGFDPDFTYRYVSDGQREGITYDRQRNRLSKLHWGVEDGKLVVSETHLPTGIIKTLRVPVVLPMDEVAKAVFARPPYAKVKDRVSGLETLEVPWREIDKIIGVSLSYSRPIPQKNKV